MYATLWHRMAESVNNVINEPLERNDPNPEQQPQNPKLTSSTRLLDQFCRLCLRQRPDLVPLLTRIRDMSVSEVFCAITGLEMTLEDSYPLKMCRTCMELLNYAYDIRQNFSESYRILRTFLLSKTQPLISNLSEYQGGVRATSETFAERELREYRHLKNQNETVGQHKAQAKLLPCVSIPQPQEESIEFPFQIKHEPELILEPEELPYPAITLAEAITNNSEPSAAESGQVEYTCEQCGNQFRFKSSLDKHVRGHKALDEGLFTCSYCDKKLPTEAALIRHERIHTGEKPYQCNVCAKRFRVSWYLTEHVSKMHTKSEHVNDGPVITCKFEGCDFSTTKQRNYHHHRAKHELKFQCTQCSQRFPNKQQLQKHQYVHTGVKDFRCQQCDKSFRFKQSLDDHVADHNNERPFACEMCGKSFARKRSFKQHQLKHSSQLSFECRHCGKKFKYRTSHAQHEKTHTEAAVKLIDLDTDAAKDN